MHEVGKIASHLKVELALALRHRKPRFRKFSLKKLNRVVDSIARRTVRGGNVG